MAERKIRRRVVEALRYQDWARYDRWRTVLSCGHVRWVRVPHASKHAPKSARCTNCEEGA